jgi:glycine oxidase
VAGLRITVVGAGIVGLWQAYTLAYRGHAVRLLERTATPFTNAASQLAGAMLAPYCERDGADPLVQELGLRGVAIWRDTCPAVTCAGSLVLALARDRHELAQFAAHTQGHAPVDAAGIAGLEPDLAGRFQQGLHYSAEAHVEPAAAMAFLLTAIRRLGAEVVLGGTTAPADGDRIVDCRGIGAGGDLPTLRGVRGERIVVNSCDVSLTRPLRLLHPRFPLYVVPWGDGLYMIGATVIESEETGPITLRSALDLLSAAYAVDPAFAEAEIVRQGAGARPAFPDNRPRIIVAKGYIYVNGLYRHGFLLAPALAELVASFIDTGATDPEVFVEHSAQR